jgi:hypothetical protein
MGFGGRCDVPFRRILVCVLSLSSVTFAQNPDAVKYAPRQILLVSPETGSEAVLPMVFTADGQQRLDFVPVSQVKESLEKGGQPIRLADLLALLSQQAETINRLQAENDKLWKVAMKDGPSQQPPTVVVQQPSSQEPSRLERYMLLRSLLPSTQPYQLPPPNANRLKTTCATRMVGNTSYTDCN